MSVDTQQTGHRNNTAAPKPGPVTRIIAGSLAAGMAAALLLTLVVFPGGTEGVITGSALVGFGLGWALIAVLTRRYTTRPQGWAAVPAGAMGVTGLALMAFDPGDDVMTTLNWVWPPLVLAMSVWMLRQVRRRKLLMAVIAVLVLASFGATFENLTPDRHITAAPGTRHQVGGHRLHLDCRGHGGPTVVLSNGLGEISASWARIIDQVAGTTRVCAYDRAGQGWSEDATHPQDGVAAAEDLHDLLAVAGENGPYVLAGHSTGGTYAMTFAARYPEQVAGMVLLDSSSPEQLTRMPAYAGQYALMRRGFALVPTVSRLGLGRLVTSASHLPAPAADQVEAMAATPRAARNVRAELSVILDVFVQAQALTTLGDRPLAVLTTTESLDGAGWAGAQDKLAGLSTNGVHRTVDSTHAGLIEDEAPAAESVHAITAVVTAVRSGSLLETK